MMDKREFIEALKRDKASEDMKTVLYAFAVCAFVAGALWMEGNYQKFSILCAICSFYQLSIVRANGVNMHWLLQYMRVFHAKKEIDDAS